MSKPVVFSAGFLCGAIIIVLLAAPIARYVPLSASMFDMSVTHVGDDDMGLYDEDDPFSGRGGGGACEPQCAPDQTCVNGDCAPDGSGGGSNCADKGGQCCMTCAGSNIEGSCTKGVCCKECMNDVDDPNSDDSADDVAVDCVPPTERPEDRTICIPNIENAIGTDMGTEWEITFICQQDAWLQQATLLGPCDAFR